MFYSKISTTQSDFLNLLTRLNTELTFDFIPKVKYIFTRWKFVTSKDFQQNT